jgi:hypothetical protein
MDIAFCGIETLKKQMPIASGNCALFDDVNVHILRGHVQCDGTTRVTKSGGLSCRARRCRNTIKQHGTKHKTTIEYNTTHRHILGTDPGQDDEKRNTTKTFSICRLHSAPPLPWEYIRHILRDKDISLSEGHIERLTNLGINAGVGDDIITMIDHLVEHKNENIENTISKLIDHISISNNTKIKTKLKTLITELENDPMISKN